MTADNTTIVRANFEAYVDKDRAAIEALLAPDFHFTSPLDNRLDRATYLARCWPNSKTTARFDFIRIVADGNTVLVTYEAETTDGHRFRNTEVLAVRGQQLIEV